MSDTHEAHAGHAATALETAVPLILIAAVALGYVLFAHNRGKEPRGWSSWRTASFLTGCTLRALGLSPQTSPFLLGGLPTHMYQHLLIGMYAPIGLVLGAPITFLLRSVPRRQGKLIGRILRAGPTHLIVHPVTALALNLGGLAVQYFTPLFTAASNAPVLHHLVHLHFLAARYLFAWVISGPDPAPRRPSVPARLLILGVAIAGHAIISHLLYAGLFVQVPASEFRQAGELMYYGGDPAELLLAFALVSTWRPQHRRQLAHPNQAQPSTVS